ncbi:GLPGLI family protein [Fulvivirga lutimaris]|uniref:GLPGLI family protein n=1 Tax=Fulvivirga lutimaris TaxID=1819566 RepID=UPI0012BD6FD4|nr:GLPGLI family protein [Fulvivirga lutimaris]MTI40615.1 GLPGLI family protein [Fulvivirga lutimaris]
MKHFILLLLLTTGFAQAQDLKGKIEYDETVQFKMNFGGDMDEAMFANIPKSNTNSYELIFAEGKSLYRSSTNPEKKAAPKQMFTTDDGAQIEIKTKRSEDVTFYNMSKKELVQKTDFMDRVFLIEDDLKNLKWKIEADTKTILGYNAQKATYTEDSTTYEAWFTTQIPASIGPSRFVGLPGAILELSVNDGERTYVATNVDLEADYSSEIESPGKGKKVTREEFVKIREEKLKEMEAEFGGAHEGGGVKVFIQKN